MPERPLDEPMVPVPRRGRVFRQQRRVALGDTSPGGRLRFDAIARYLQDVSNEDTRDAAFDELMAWVARRTVVDVRQPAVFGEVVELATFCGGIGGRWAERRVSLRGDQGASIEAATLWVHLDLDTFRPKRLSPQFHTLFGEAAGGRTVRARLHLAPVPTAESSGGDGLAGGPWPLRFTDFDVMGHLNNAAYWEVLEEELARRRDLRGEVRAAVEFVNQVEPGAQLTVQVRDGADGVELWLVDSVTDTAVAAAALWRPLQPQPASRSTT